MAKEKKQQKTEKVPKKKPKKTKEGKKQEEEAQKDSLHFAFVDRQRKQSGLNAFDTPYKVT